MTATRALFKPRRGVAGVNLASVDLNLLVALQALLEQRNVTYAGQQVGLSQPAMSRALSRLRDLFSDDLLVRTSKGLILTARGDQLLRKLPAAMDQIGEILTARHFRPDDVKLRTSVAMAEHQALVLLPKLLPRLRAKAPNMDVITHALLSGSLKLLESGEIDFAVGQVDETPPGFFCRTLYQDRLVCLLRRDHPSLQHAWTEEVYSSLRHAVIAPQSREGFGQVYDILTKLDLSDRDPLVMPSMMAAPVTVAETDLVLTVPRRVAQRAASMLPLVIKEVPVTLGPYQVSLIWHERCHRSGEHSWMRSEIAAASMSSVEVGSTTGEPL